MKFAIDLESNFYDYYSNSELLGKHQGLNNEFVNRANKAKQRKQHLERSRRENVTEIILEPIENLNPEDFQFDMQDYSIDAINHNEKVATKFYEVAGPKINVLETQRLFKNCKKQHATLNLENK